MRHATLFVAGFTLVLLEGHTAVQAAELPQVLTGVNARFEGAQLPVVNGNNMVINQFADKATLNWRSFNIGAGGQVEFKQPSSSAVALNRIFDAAPSQVNGKLTANGQVYLINQNGIVFGPQAQVSTQSLVASTLDIDDKVYKDIGFVNAINQPAGALPAFDSMGKPMGSIQVEQGANLEAAKSGRILIFAPSIVNKGTISTPEGQQVLAAAKDKVLIAASDDPALRGLFVEVSTGGDVTNLGSLIAERGNISLVGLAVNQEGLARATTSVSLNGSIRLLAQDMNGTLSLGNDLVPRRPKAVRGGEVRLGAGSVTEVVPDRGLDENGAEVLATDAQVQPQSRIEVAGTKVRLASGSRLTATGGFIDLTAAANPAQPELAVPGDPATVAAEVVVERGAVVDASGDDTTRVSVARNVVTVEARGNELADSPLQRDGPLRNQTLQVDIRRGTKLLKIDGAAAAIGRSAAERQSAGGSVRIRSEGNVVVADGATIDVSGGKVTYGEGLVSTSRLQQANGKVVDISNADPDQVYRAVVGSTVSREAGYVEGKDAGSLDIQARGIDLRGAIAAGSIAGVNQRQQPGSLAAGTPVYARPYDQVPLAGALALTLLRSGLPQLVLGAAPAGQGGAIPPLVLSPEQIRASGAGRIGLVNAGPVLVNGPLELPAWSDLSLIGTQVSVLGPLRIAGGRLSLNSSNQLVGPGVVPDQDLLVRIDGAVDLSGTWVNDNPLLDRDRPTAPVVLDGGSLVVRSGFAVDVGSASRIDVSAGGYRTAAGAFSGGRGGSMAFATGSAATNPILGAPLRLGGELRAFGFSAGGSLSIDTERIHVVGQPGAGGDGDLRLLGGRQFALREVDDGLGTSQYVLEVGAGTFQQGGFSTFSLASTRSDLAVETGSDVVLRTASYLLTGASPSLTRTGSAISSVAAPAFAPAYARQPARLTLSSRETLGNAIGAAANLGIAAGARITADAGSSITLQSANALTVDGTVAAPAGQISLVLGGGPGIFRPEQVIRLGSGALLDASGTALLDPLAPLGQLRGTVLNAGKVSVRADQGSLIAEAGSRIVVDGVAATLDTGFGIPVRRKVAGAAGSIELAAAESLLYQGSLSGAAPAGSSAAAGRLTVALDPSRRGVAALVGADGIPRGPHTLVVADFAGSLPAAGSPVDPQYYSTGFVPLAALKAGGFSALDLVVRSSAAGTNDVGAPTPDTPESLPVIEFPNDLVLALGRSIRLDAGIVRTSGARVDLAAPYASLGYSDARVPLDGAIPDKTSATNPQEATTPIRLTPTAGAGLLRVAGELIELVGEMVTQGFGDAAAGRDGVILQASGDVRMRGVRKVLQDEYGGLFRTAGNLVIDAARIYPTTLTTFEVSVAGTGGRLTLGGGAGGNAPPLSVGGQLTLKADDIVQGGALFAPLGTLDLQAGASLRFASGSLTSTSGLGVYAPFFRTEPDGSLVLPAPGVGEDQIVFVETVNNDEFERALPEKRIRLTAPAVELESGSRFDLRGGSAAAATEFVPGPGGSADILLADLDRTAGVLPNASFAIMPGLSGYAPYDPLETPAAESIQGIRIGDTLVLEEGMAGLPAGEYAILPARYALFGGYLVTPQKGYQDLGAGQALRRLDGAPILAGRYGVAGNDTVAARSQGFAIQTGAQVRQRAEYLLTPLDDFYTGGTLRAPRDGGQLTINAGDRLDLRGELLRQQPGGGLGSAVDIATAAALSVVRDFTGAGGIQLRAQDLANLGADSLLLGGTRSAVAGGSLLSVTSSQITVDAGVDLDQRELLLVGRRIVVDGSTGAGTRLASSRDGNGTEARFVVADDAAVLALSDRQLALDRVGGGAGVSTISLAADTRLEAGGGLILDAASDVDARGSLAVRNGTLNLGAGSIALGETDGQPIGSGLVLSNADLGAIAGSDLRLRSRGLVQIYGAVGGQGAGAPLAFRRLGIDAPGIRGLANDGATAVLAAGVIAIGNSSGLGAGSAPAAAAPGSGLELRASERLDLAAGSLAIDGFATTRLSAGSSVSLTGDGSVGVAGNLVIETPVITAARTARNEISATGRLSVAGGGAGAATAAGAGLGAELRLAAADIDFAGRVLLPSGTVRLTQLAAAAGSEPVGIRIGPNAVLDVSGATLAFGPARVGTPGGALLLAAESGSLDVAPGAVLDVSAATTGDSEAGEVQWRAPLGTVSFAPGVRLLGASPGAGSGAFLLDAGRLASTGETSANPLTPLLDLLEAGGFRDSRALRVRQQDIAIDAGSVVNARQIRVVADSGRVDIAGTLDASGEGAGSIWLAAGDSLNVSGSLNARGTGSGAAGGRIDLYALDADGDDPHGAQGDVVNLAAGSVIDVSGGSNGAGGEVFVHARRLDTDADGQTDLLLLGDLGGTIIGADRAQLVATRVLRDPGASQVADAGTGQLVTRVTITGSRIEAWRSEAEAFITGLAAPAAGPLQVVAGLQVESSGDLVLLDPWNFMEGWHFGQDLGDPMAPSLGVTGITTLRAARNLELRADLTDAFAEQFLFGFIPFDGVAGAVPRLDESGAVMEELVPQSWGYRLAAGADLGSADVLALGTGTGSVRLAPGVRLRTGAADIDLAASGDVRLQTGAAIYAAGWDRGLSAQLKQVVAPVADPFGLTAYDFFGTFLNGGQFATGGGSVTVTAGGNLVADAAPGRITEWLTRVGSGEITTTKLYSATEGYGAMPTHWAVAYGQFRNGVAAFGGGDLRVAVGGDVRNAVLAVPTTGRALDGVVADTSTGTLVFQPSARTTEILGGGRLDLRTGGGLSGGQLVLGRGAAVVRNGGAVGRDQAPVLYVGADARVDWVARGGLRLGGIQDPTVAPLSDTQLARLGQILTITSTEDIDNRFFTYTDASKVSLRSLGADVVLDGSGFSSFLPPSMTAVALGGDIRAVATPLDFFPSATSSLVLLARDNISGNFSGSNEARIRQSDQDRSQLPSVDRPDLLVGPSKPAAIPVHTGDPAPNLFVARDGSIQSAPGKAGYWNIELAKQAVFQAGRDISNLLVRVQHTTRTALSSFLAGRDIVQGELRDNTGRFATNDRRIFEIAGPGSAEFVAYRNIALGTSAGIESVGNTRNAALPADGASLRLLAGTGGEPAYDRFIDVYLATASAYRDDLNAFLASIDAARAGFPASSARKDLTIGAGEYAAALDRFLLDYGIPVLDGDPVATFRALDRSLQRILITAIAFAEIKTWGSAAETPDRADRLNYVRGYTALDTLFALSDPLGVRADDFTQQQIRQAVQGFLTTADPKAANDAQVQLLGALFPPGPPRGGISLLLSQVQTLAGGSLAMLAPGGDINAGAADADIIAKAPADLGIVTARGGNIDIAVGNNLLVNSTRVFALQGDLLAWSSNGNIDAGKGAKTITSVPDPITRIDPNTGDTIIEFPPAVAGSGLQGENAALFAPRGAVNAGDAGIRTRGDLTIGAVEIVGTDNIDVGGVEIGFSTTDVAPVAPPGAAAASSAATKGMDSQVATLSDANAGGERTILGTEVKFISVEVLSFGKEGCDPDREKCD